MKEHNFYEAAPDPEALYDFEPSMFHRITHLRLQRSEGWIWFFVKDEKRQRVTASLFLHVDDQQAQSSVRSPFGTLECVENIPPETLFSFMAFVGERLQKHGVNSIRITCAPYAYTPRINSMLYAFLPMLGYQIAKAELSACMPTGGDFLAGMGQTQKQTYLKAIHAGLDFQLTYIDRAEEVYNFINRHHQAKGYPLSMTWEDLSATIAKFQDRFILSGAFDGQKLIAASIAIRVRDNVLYNFYMDHDPAYDRFMPVLVLLRGLYDYAAEHGIPLLDLGTSTVDGKPNFGLLSFKTRLGAELTPKISFAKRLA